MPFVRRASSALLVVIGLLMLVAVATSVMAQGVGQSHDTFSITGRDVIYGLLGIVMALIGVWSRIQDKRIAEANANGVKALEKCHALELQIVRLKAQVNIKE